MLIQNIFLGHLLMMLGKDVVVVFGEISLGVVDVDKAGPEDRK